MKQVMAFLNFFETPMLKNGKEYTKTETKTTVSNSKSKTILESHDGFKS